MNELTERLTVDQPIVMGGADPTVEELRERTGEMAYVLVKFTQTRGGTELGFPLDPDATDLSGANFENGTGSVHVEGHLTLNNDPVRCIANINLATLEGTGRLKLEEKATASTR
jgi:core binding factor beta subunit